MSKKTPRFDEKSMDVNFTNAYINKGNQALDLSENVKRRFTKSQLSERAKELKTWEIPSRRAGAKSIPIPEEQRQGQRQRKDDIPIEGQRQRKDQELTPAQGQGKGKTNNKAWTSPKGKGKTKGKGTKGKGYGETKGAHKGKGGWTSPYWIGAYPGLWT